MLEIVLWFGFITAIGEFILLRTLSRKLRLWLTGPGAVITHFGFAAFNLWIHWGTVTGTMTAVVAFIVSTVVCHFVRRFEKPVAVAA